MEITEVRIKLVADSDDRLQAFCSITFDNCFVVRDLKIIEGPNGPFVAMPSRRLTAHCPKCSCKNHLRAKYCNQCSVRLPSSFGRETGGRTKLYADIAHPIHSECRDAIQSKVIEEFEAEVDRAQEPEYRSRYDEEYDDLVDRHSSEPEMPANALGNVRIQEPEAELRPPHGALSDHDRTQTRRDEGEQFGAGIF
ncbi:MAG: stage V sporulation protein G [Planctomycetaceae bacterium]|nr:stage V sporulation protein G [Planctomycetaceae bacterium]